MIRAANTGISAVIDAYGRVSAGLSLGTEGIIDQSIQVSRVSSFWLTTDRNLVGLVVVAIAALLAFAWRLVVQLNLIAHLRTN